MSDIHVVYGGRNETLNFGDIFTGGEEPKSITHDQVKTALAHHYDVSTDEFEAHFVEVNPNGNITVRPNAKWGQGS
jgi:hypothetical protein